MVVSTILNLFVKKGSCNLQNNGSIEILDKESKAFAQSLGDSPLAQLSDDDYIFDLHFAK